MFVCSRFPFQTVTAPNNILITWKVSARENTLARRSLPRMFSRNRGYGVAPSCLRAAATASARAGMVNSSGSIWGVKP